MTNRVEIKYNGNDWCTLTIDGDLYRNDRWLFEPYEVYELLTTLGVNVEYEDEEGDDDD